MKLIPKYYISFLIVFIFTIIVSIFYYNISVESKEQYFEVDKEFVAVSWDYQFNKIYLNYFNDSIYFNGWMDVKHNPGNIDFLNIRKNKNIKISTFYKNEIEKVEFDSILLVENRCDYNNTYLITKDSVFIQMTYRNGCKGEIYHSKSQNNQILFSKFLCLFIEKNWNFKPEYSMEQPNSPNLLIVYIKQPNSNWAKYNFKVNHALTQMYFDLFDLYNNEMKNLKFYDSFEFCFP